MTSPLLLLCLCFCVIDQAAAVCDLLAEIRQRFCFDDQVLIHNSDLTGLQVHFHVVALFNFFYLCANLQHRQADVDGIAVEDAGKAVRDDALDAFNFDYHGGVLTG